MNETIRRKKLIEVALPLEAINKASAHEKMPGIGPHPRGLHTWWARRPLAACRAMIFAQVVDDPSSWPDRFPTDEDQKRERERLHGVIEAMVPWAASTNEHVLNNARWEIARSVAWGLGEEPPDKSDQTAVLEYLSLKAPPVYDPFSGGGSIPLEAQRLGLCAYGSDLNPVAVLISKALVEIPPKFAGVAPVNPDRDLHISWKHAEGLSEDVKYYGRMLQEKAEERVGHLYPKVRTKTGKDATVIAWLWARTVCSPDPMAKGAKVPLVSSFVLSTKKGSKAWADIIVDSSAEDGWRFDVGSGNLSAADEKQKKLGTRGSGSAEFVCCLTGAPISAPFIRQEAKAGRLGQRLMAIVADGSPGRIYLSPNEEHEELSKVTIPDDVPTLEIHPSALGFRIQNYGLTKWCDVFTPRQLLLLTTLSDSIDEIRACVEADALAAVICSPLSPRL